MKAQNKNFTVQSFISLPYFAAVIVGITILFLLTWFFGSPSGIPLAGQAIYAGDLSQVQYLNLSKNVRVSGSDYRCSTHISSSCWLEGERIKRTYTFGGGQLTGTYKDGCQYAVGRWRSNDYGCFGTNAIYCWKYCDSGDLSCNRDRGMCSGDVYVPPPTCFDGIKNQDETDVDCGGLNCGNCAGGDACLADIDCDSGLCDGGICATMYDTFSGSSLDTSLWEETAASDSGTQFVNEHTVLNGVYHTTQTTAVENRAVTLITTRQFRAGESVNLDIIYNGGSSNRLSRLYFDGSGEGKIINERYLDTRLRAAGYNLKGYATSGDIGYWNGDSEVGNIIGTYHIKMEFVPRGADITITNPNGVPFTFEVSFPLPARVGFSTKVSDSLMEVDYDNVIVSGEQLPVGCTDSDGDDLTIKGTAVQINEDGSTIVREDGCDAHGSDWWINERICTDNMLGSTLVPCPTNACSEGACV